MNDNYWAEELDEAYFEGYYDAWRDWSARKELLFGFGALTGALLGFLSAVLLMSLFGR